MNIMARGGMFQPSDRSPGLVAEPERCWTMVHDHNLQVTHCRDVPTGTGWFSPRIDQRWRAWASPEQLDRLTAMREFGVSG
jgi:hypothetical protein